MERRQAQLSIQWRVFRIVLQSENLPFIAGFREMTSPIRSRWRMLLVVGIAVAGTVGTAIHGPIIQDPSYHRFADQRTLLGIPNFWNVVSNLPFLAVGVLGACMLHHGNCSGMLAPLRRSYAVLFLAAALIGLGSSYYHVKPTDFRLLWDRLPMTLAFMAFLAIIVGEHIDSFTGQAALPPLLAIGLASVLWWWYGGDLRPYVLVQYLPFLIVPLIVILFPSRLSHPGLIWGVIAAYALAKGFELSDNQIYRVMGISGHALKHLAAASGISLLLRAIKYRRPREIDNRNV
jgi:hypothetical protein